MPHPQGTVMILTSVFELIESDVCGSLNVKSFAGNLYFVTFIDYYSRKIHVKMRVNYELKNYVECQNAIMVRSN